MIKHTGEGLYDVYTRDLKTLVAENITLKEAIKILCKVKGPTPKWVEEINRRRENAEVWKKESEGTK